MRASILFILFFSFYSAFGQNFTVSGSLRDGETGEDLIGATISVEELPGVGTSANAYGFYSLTLEKGEYTLVYEYIGLEKVVRKINLDQPLEINIELGQSSIQMEEVVIKAERDDANVSETKMSVTKLDPKDIASVPVIFGEKDIIKTLQLTPGVKTAGEGNSGFYVRGGGIDQNLILLDEAPVYNASHLLGFFSVFNSDAIKDVTLYKGGIPAEFGGRASSVMDIKMKDGNSKRLGVSGGVGLISSRLTVEAPIVKDKGSFMISGRRTYADVFLGLATNEALKNSTLYFYDLNAKANYRITKKDRIYLSGYFGRDIFGFNDNQFGFNWGNTTGTLRWNHLFSEKLFSNTSLIYSDYDYKFNASFGENASFSVSSGIEDINLKQDFSWFPSPNNTVKFGFNAVYHTFLPGEISSNEGSIFNDEKIPENYAMEGALYIQNDQKISDKISLNYGIRYAMFNQLGPGLIKTYDPEGTVTSENTFGDWESVKYYGGFEPRASAKYQINQNSSVKLSFTRNYQFVHLLSNSTTTTPTDVWVPSSVNVKPQISDQVAFGYFRNLFKNQYELSVETYYKTLENQIDYKNGADLILNPEVESELVFGDGYAYGAEFYLRKRKGDFTGWISYSVGRTFRRFKEINDGEYFPARQDRIHDLAVVGIYNITARWNVSGTFVFYTGDAATFPSGRYKLEGISVPYYTERNGYRFPNYNRMDLGATYISSKSDRFESSWNLSIYNVYGRENAFTIDFRQSEDNPNENEAFQIALFKWVPSLSYNFKF
ncbi:TonB-dependent receptor [Portibacter lacus]|uniref:Collagen-binding protein n=1 Tax=Portibacter lacus TaxID=1099794 RepID=A0AA37SNV6_9BACT|nr:TonB-dependent receptor [Portibacter lacus]GLR16206.1 collagen-binding protein [Portibacter lacus]